ncbi:succinate-semialdehyde dehydrogenase [Spiribacter sp. C176]|uniref:Succinate-semialdehyde dehydrogenase n=1 Tax=Spiribacter salilacus TaxID=2664894 RepID=A0A6N7QPB7_9GAMM|nr:NAD-dependent succinate-semialdehyde dehydrogenase [Spiribacter salilacus]MRH78231.1 succinate-semialdehyde dehydrogenase [Spiribacter salilacus]
MSIELKDPSLLEPRALIAGEWIAGASQADVINPATGEVVARAADLGVDDMRRAIDAAYAAGPAWSAKTAKERADILMRWHDLMMENQEDLAQILTAEMGKPIVESRGEIAYGASFIRWFAEEARRIYGDIIPAPMADRRMMVLRQPIGVVGSITPWNFPNAMIARKVAPALAAGCTFVGRPAEDTPLSATAMAVLAQRAGVPDGVINIVTGTDAAGLGLELCTNFKVRKLTFTGSTEVGRILMRQCAQNITKLSLELGGNAPFIVFDDADVDAAVDGAIAAKFRNGGQTCVCANRIYAQSGIYDAFVERLAEKVAALQVGPGHDDQTQIGPLINTDGVAKVQRHLDDAVAQGARVLTGGKAHALGGLYFEPTVVADISKGMALLNEETFGPLAPVARFNTEEEAITQANDTEFGLAAYFFSRDLSRMWRVSEALEYGIVGVNSGVVSTAEAPFGGVKASGLGREGSRYGIEDFLEMKYICVTL